MTELEDKETSCSIKIEQLTVSEYLEKVCEVIMSKDIMECYSTNNYFY